MKLHLARMQYLGPLLVVLAGRDSQAVRLVKVDDARCVHAVVKVVGVGRQGGKLAGSGKFGEG